MFQQVMNERRNKEQQEAKNNSSSSSSSSSYEPPKDFLQVLMNATYRDGSKLTDVEITGIMIAVLLGGQHTSNVTGTWLLCHLLHSPQWLQAIMEEQKQIILGKTNNNNNNNNNNNQTTQDGITTNDDVWLQHPTTLSWEQVVNEMPIFDQVLSETLRLHPPFFQLSRSVKQSTSIYDNQYVIPKGHYVNISPSASHRFIDLWGQHAEQFDPNRFTSEHKIQHPRYAWIPFGGGIHQCGGRKFAWNSLKVALSWILRNYELELIHDGAKQLPNEDYTTMVVAPTKQHCRVKYRRRQRPTQQQPGQQ